MLGGGLLAATGSWRPMFWLLAAISAVLALAAWRLIPETLPVEERHSGGLRQTGRAFAGLARDRVFVGYALTVAFAYASLFGYISGSSFALQDVYGLTATQFSLVFAANAAGMIVLGLLNARLVRRFPVRRLLVVGLAASTVAAAVLLVAVLTGSSLVAVLAPLFVVVATRGLVSSNATVLGVQQAPGGGLRLGDPRCADVRGRGAGHPADGARRRGHRRADGGGGRRWCDRGPVGHRAPYTTTVTVSAEDFGPILAQVREFVRDEVVPREREIADTNAVPDDLRAQAAEMGLFGYALPEEYGGLGLDLTQDVELALELGYTTPAFRSLFGTNNGIAGQVLVGYGTEAQKKRWLEAMAAGRRGGLVRADRARGRVRPVGHAHHRHAATATAG